MQKKGAALRAVQMEEVAPEHGPEHGGAGSDPSSALTSFTPVPRRYRHDGWTPERQKAFIAALADTGCVTRAARMVNIAQTNAYELRRAPGAESFAGRGTRRWISGCCGSRTSPSSGRSRGSWCRSSRPGS